MWPSPAVPWQSPASAAPAVSGGRSAARRAISSASRSQAGSPRQRAARSEEHTSELQSRLHLVCRLLLEKKKKNTYVASWLVSPRISASHIATDAKPEPPPRPPRAHAGCGDDIRRRTYCARVPVCAVLTC